MRRITVIGDDCVTKNIILLSLNASYDLVDLLPLNLNFDNIGKTDLAIYVSASQPNTKVLTRLRDNYKGLILIANTDRLDESLGQGDLFVSAADLDLASSISLSKVQLIRVFIDGFVCGGAKLSSVQRSIIEKLSKGLPENDIWVSLSISRATYYRTLSELRALYGVSKNLQLTEVLRS